MDTGEFKQIYKCLGKEHLWFQAMRGLDFFSLFPRLFSLLCADKCWLQCLASSECSVGRGGRADKSQFYEQVNVTFKRSFSSDASSKAL